MRRREFFRLLGGAATWPLGARAQQLAMPVVGFLHSGSPGPFASEAAAFIRGLKQTGFVEGQNVLIESRWAEGQLDRLPALAADLVRRQVSVIVAPGGDVTALAAKAATATVPIVFLNGSDPVKSGLVTSINRPGGNITGVSLFAGTVDTKRLELLHQLVPQVNVVAVFNNPLVAETEARSKALGDAAKIIGLQLLFLNVSSEGDFDTAFTTIASRKIGALFVSGSPFFINRRNQLVGLAARQKIPAIYAWRQIVAAGGLMSYGTNFDEFRLVNSVSTRGAFSKGERRPTCRFCSPRSFDFAINLKTAKALDIEIPDKLIALADEVIE